MRIPEHVKDLIYQATDIVDVVGDYVQLKKKGANYWGLSPFRNERTPSFSVHREKGIYKDFSSGKGGTAVGFLMELEGYTYTEALLHLARKYNIEVPLEEGDTAERSDARESLSALNNYAARWFHTQLMESAEGKSHAQTYFRERGFTEETLTRWQLGYSPESWDAFTQHALQQQYQEKFLLDTGLSLRSEKTGNLLDRFHGRVMFPILDITGKVAGFGARILGTDPKAAKYLNSPDSPVYNKSQMLYGLYFARQKIRDQGRAILVEGYTDVLALHQAGIQTAVASCGTSLVEDQVRILGRYTREIVILYDGDSPGIQATRRAIPLILAQGLTPRVLHLPEGHDPDSYLKQYGPAAFETYAVEHTQGFLSFLVQLLVPAGSDTPVRARAAEELAELVALIPDAIAQDLYLQELAGLLRLEQDLLRNAVQQKTHEQATRLQKRQAREHRNQVETVQPAIAPEDSQVTVNPLEVHEREILRLLINYPQEMVEYEGRTLSVFELMTEYVSEITFGSEIYEQIRQYFFIYYPQRQEATLALMQDELPQPVAYAVNTLLGESHHLSEHWQRIDVNTPLKDANLSAVVDQVILYYKRARYLRMQQELLASLRAQQEGDPDGHAPETLVLLQRSMKLDVLLQQVSSQLKNVVY
ncbi:MAG: DNA primase [Bacteroidetes bacterium]|nr:DNA primase [Bacteroidota bacterium]